MVGLLFLIINHSFVHDILRKTAAGKKGAEAPARKAEDVGPCIPRGGYRSDVRFLRPGAAGVSNISR